MPRLSLVRGEAVRVFGPMSITIVKGSIAILGKTVRGGENIIVHRFRNYVIEALEDTELDVTMTSDSTIQPVDEHDPYRKRASTALEIVSKGHRRVVVIGGVDSGKTSFTTLLSNTAISAGLKPCVIDGDVGQADIGPPGFISLGIPDRQVLWNTEIPVYMMRFIGDIRPQGYTHVIPRELRWLAEKSESLGCSIIVIDTDGWIRDPGAVYYKQRLIEIVEPDAVVILGDDLSRYFKRFEKIGVKVYELPEPTVRRTRSREERRLLRSMRYRDFLVDAPLRRVNMDTVLVDGHPLFHGVQVESSMLDGLVEGRVIYASQLVNELHVYGTVKAFNSEEINRRLGVVKVKTYPPGFEKGVYCGVGSHRGGDYPCIVEKFDFEGREILVRTRFQDRIDVLKLSQIRIGEDYTEEFIEV
ncbi:Clp1/GlmU family protein [Desulfurococcus mucosus]|uniref:polynucleotide 5'-hydroxyl-kinase n=1 Tax=Desulfurococcus mucosus (strain ATCC 35584 / DSM 2162 / JCM 9187 / O7/1) TaxID=765177 RepID=E8R927_DESM0|nr:Clp1/GlmU family protein [Desulfurococcus mucosus]ADV65003.1 putative GTPase or GTP-binding protein [Desulfurococcus mucosus DSM 2162]